MKKYIPAVFFLLTCAAAAGVLMLFGTSSLRKGSSATHAATPQLSESQVARDFEYAYNSATPRTIRVTKVYGCYKNPRDATQFACVAAVANGTGQTACGAFKFTLKPLDGGRISFKTDSAKIISNRYCA